MGLVLIFSFLNVTLDPIFQSLLYVGPIVVFFAFVILFLGEPKERSRYRFKAFGVLGASLVFASFIGVLSYLGSLPTFSGNVAFNIVDLADSLLNDYGLLIVVLGLLLAAAAFGAVALAKKEAEERVNELQFFIAASALFFAIGVYGLLSKKSAIRILFSIEIIINAASLNIAAFARFSPYNLGSAQSITIFIIALAAAEAAAGLALIIEAFRIRGKVDVNEMDELKG